MTNLDYHRKNAGYSGIRSPDSWYLRYFYTFGYLVDDRPTLDPPFTPIFPERKNFCEKFVMAGSLKCVIEKCFLQR